MYMKEDMKEGTTKEGRIHARHSGDVSYAGQPVSEEQQGERERERERAGEGRREGGRASEQATGAECRETPPWWG